MADEPDGLYDTVGAEDAEEQPAETQRDTRLNDGAGLDIAKPEDFSISRDEDGDLMPVRQRIPGTDKAIKVKPLSGGAREEYNDVITGTETDAHRVAELWQSHIIEGVGANATPHDIEEVYPYGLIAGINQALKNSSGEDIFLAVREQQNEEVKANMGMVDALGEDALGTLMAQMDELPGSENGKTSPDESVERT